MSEILKRPYEISIWEEKLTTDSETGQKYYKENKIAVVGSDKMTAPNRVYSPVLTKNVNGEKSLTFSLAYRYYDEQVGDFVMNPFRNYLVNERKVKLYYNDEWYEFLIKECEESRDNEFKYTAVDAFVNELSKTGYNVTFDANDLNNNLGNVTDLAAIALEDTDWKVDVENSDVLVQTVSEPLYKAKIEDSDLEVLNLDSGETTTIEIGEYVYVFYSCLIEVTIPL